MRYLFLPEEYRKDFQKTYTLRLASFYVVGIGLAAIIGVSLKVPNYLSSNFDKVEADNLLTSLEKQGHMSGALAVSAEAKEAEKLIKVFANMPTSVPVQTVIGLITSKVITDITLTSISIPNLNMSSTTFALQGKAKTRDILLTFKKDLESDPYIISASLPVSDLTKNKDIDFNMSVLVDFSTLNQVDRPQTQKP